MKKEKNGKGRKIGKIILKICGVIAAVIVLAAAVGAIATVIGNKANTKLAESFSAVENPDAITPELDADGNWSFTADRDLKILQLTDVHIGGGWMSVKKDAMAINAVASMVTAEKPDLVVITGDIAYPVPFQAGTFNNLSSAKIFARLMETLGVYWIPVFGNHDTELYSYYSREDISKFYESDELKHCLFKSGDENVDGYGNSVINVKNSKGIITQSLFFLDSHSYTDGDFLGLLWKYDNIHQNQVDWYKEQSLKFSEQNRTVISSLYSADSTEYKDAEEKYGDISSLLFFHIPLKEYRDAWTEYVDNGYNDTENVRYKYGLTGETGDAIYCGIGEDNLFETMQELGGGKGIFCGHDHLNNFSLDYKGIRLTYGYSIDYLAYSGIYKYGSQRGCTIITVRPDATFDCEKSNYYQDKYKALSGNTKEDVTMDPYNAETVNITEKS